MAASAQKLQELRDSIGQVLGTAKRDFVPAFGVPCGIPRGSLVELSGPQKTEWLIAFLRDQSTLLTCWLEKDQTVLPTAIHQRGVDLSRITFCHIPDPFPVLRRVLQAQLHEVIIAPSVFDEDRVLKGLQLAVEKANCILFLVAKESKPAWPISVQLHIGHSPTEDPFHVRVIKHKLAGIS